MSSQFLIYISSHELYLKKKLDKVFNTIYGTTLTLLSQPQSIYAVILEWKISINRFICLFLLGCLVIICPVIILSISCIFSSFSSFDDLLAVKSDFYNFLMVAVFASSEIFPVCAGYYTRKSFLKPKILLEIIIIAPFFKVLFNTPLALQIFTW